MPVGYVKWFNATKGYGFLAADGLSDDVFVHYTAIAMSGYRTLKENTRVTFEMVSNPHDQRLMATMVTPMDPIDDWPSQELDRSALLEHPCGA